MEDKSIGFNFEFKKMYERSDMFYHFLYNISIFLLHRIGDTSHFTFQKTRLLTLYKVYR